MKKFFLLIVLLTSFCIRSQYTIYSNSTNMICWNGKTYVNCSPIIEYGNVFRFENNYTLLTNNYKFYKINLISLYHKTYMYKILDDDTYNYLILDKGDGYLKFLPHYGKTMVQYTIDRMYKNSF